MMLPKVLDILHGSIPFRGLEEAEMAAVLGAGEVRAFASGAVVFRQDSDGREVYVVVDGEVEITVDANLLDEGVVRPRVLARLRPGQSFGEIALLEDAARSASAHSVDDATRVFVLRADRLDALCRERPRVGLVVYRNLGAVASHIAREQTRATVDALMRDHFVGVLAEELAGELRYCDPSRPIEKTVATRDAQSFVLSQLQKRTRAEAPLAQESFRFVVFAHLGDLWSAFGDGEPSGLQILGYLFSLLRDGKPLDPFAAFGFEHSFGPGDDRRSGTLAFRKRRGADAATWFLHWQVKGIERSGGVASATIVLHLAARDANACDRYINRVVEGLGMPIQRALAGGIPAHPPAGAGFRVLTVHHRTPEVAFTLRTLGRLGFTLDSYIGIPYGSASWPQARLLDHTSARAYYCLRSIEHPVAPTEYRFDYAQSSFLAGGTEADMGALFDAPDSPAGSGPGSGSTVTGGRVTDYLGAMTRLCEYLLARALERCAAEGSRLLIYEDGGYLVPRIHAVYRDERHPLHAAVRRAIDDRVLVGALEVTTAGERKDRDAIAHNGGRALLPVLSCAREDVKQIYEGLGVSEAVIHAASTALGNLGLATFSVRRVAILGANGAIGTRLVDHLILSHNSTANIFSVDVADVPFHREVDRARYPHAAARVDYHPFPRFLVTPGCRVLFQERPLGGAATRAPLDREALRAALERLFDGAGGIDELALTNAEAPRDGGDAVDLLLAETAAASSFTCEGTTPLPAGAGQTVTFVRGAERRQVTRLHHGTVLQFRDLERLIRAGVDTVIGATGFEAFREVDLDAFLERPAGQGTPVDMLVLASASSKDYEFKRALVLLGRLLSLQHDGARDVDQALGWLAGFYRERRSFVTDGGVDAAAVVAEIEATSGVAARRALALSLVEKLTAVLSIHKEVRPDIGLIYHLVYRGRPKTLVMLANGFVVNFFAQWEKGVKTEFIDPVVSMQMLGLVRLTRTDVPSGLHPISDYLDPADIARCWGAIEACCAPPSLDGDGGGIRRSS